MSDQDRGVVNFLFEVGILAKTPRSGFHFLGTGDQSDAEHILRTAYIGYTLASLSDNIDIGKVLKMCLFHDLAETRTGDLNHVNQKYMLSDEQKVIEELTGILPFGGDIKTTLLEYKERKTQESILAKEADVLEWILSLKEQHDIGNTRAKAWMTNAVKRLKTPLGKKLAAVILETDSEDWHFGDKDDDWWVNRNEAVHKTRF